MGHRACAADVVERTISQPKSGLGGHRQGRGDGEIGFEPTVDAGDRTTEVTCRVDLGSLRASTTARASPVCRQGLFCSRYRHNIGFEAFR